MANLAPHGGCTWEGCKICFPPGTPYPQSWKTPNKGATMEKKEYAVKNRLPVGKTLDDVKDGMTWLYTEPFGRYYSEFEKNEAHEFAEESNRLRTPEFWAETQSGLLPGTKAVVVHRHIQIGEWTSGNC